MPTSPTKSKFESEPCPYQEKLEKIIQEKLWSQKRYFH